MDKRLSARSDGSLLSHAKQWLGKRELLELDTAARDSYRHRTFGAAHKVFLEEKPNWSRNRKLAAKVMESVCVELLLAAVISFNSVLVIMETDLTAAKEDVPAWIQSLSIVFLCFYCGELALRIFVARRFFFHSPSNVFDFFIVVSDVLSEVLSHIVVVELSFLRIFRLGRLLRFVAVLTMFEDLRHLISLMLKSIWALAWGAFLIGSLLICWSLLAVQFLHPWNLELAQAGKYGENCNRCEKAFESVSASTLTFVQHLIFGDSWGAPSVVLIENHPASAIILLGAGVTIICGLLNLILTVIVDKAHEQKEEDAERLLKKKEALFFKAKSSLSEICADLDADNDGEITLDELIYGFDNNSSFATIMSLMDITRDDVPNVFCMLDDDASGTVSYQEFVDQVHKMRVADTRTLLLFLKGNITEVRQKINKQLVGLRELIHYCAEQAEKMTERMNKLSNTSSPTLASPFQQQSSPTLESKCEANGRRLGRLHLGEDFMTAPLTSSGNGRLPLGEEFREASFTSSTLAAPNAGANIFAPLQATLRNEIHLLGSVLAQKIEHDFIHLVSGEALGNGSVRKDPSIQWQV